MCTLVQLCRIKGQQYPKGFVLVPNDLLILPTVDYNVTTTTIDDIQFSYQPTIIVNMKHIMIIIIIENRNENAISHVHCTHSTIGKCVCSMKHKRSKQNPSEHTATCIGYSAIPHRLIALNYRHSAIPQYSI